MSLNENTEDIELIIHRPDTSPPENSTNTKLMSLLLEQNYAEFVCVLKTTTPSRLDVNYFYNQPHNGTLLDVACRSKGYSKFASILILCGAQVDVINRKSGKAPIHEAVEIGDKAMVKLLIQKKIKLRDCGSIKDEYIEQLRFEYQELDKYCSSGSDYHLNDMNGRMPVMIAAYHAHCHILPLFMKNDDVSLEPVGEKTILHSLIEGMRDAKKEAIWARGEKYKYYRCLDYILDELQYEKLKELIQDPIPLLSQAANLKDKRIIKTLSIALRHEYKNSEEIAELNTHEFRLHSHETAKCDKLLSLLNSDNLKEFRTLMLSNRYLVNYFYKDPQNGTLLDIACRLECREQFVRVLLECGAKINLINKATGMAPIHEAVKNNAKDTLDIFMGDRIYGEHCDININDILGQIPIMKAAYLAHEEILFRLLEDSKELIAKKTIIHMMIDGLMNIKNENPCRDKTKVHEEKLYRIISRLKRHSKCQQLFELADASEFLSLDTDEKLNSMFLEPTADLTNSLQKLQDIFDNQAQVQATILRKNYESVKYIYTRESTEGHSADQSDTYKNLLSSLKEHKFVNFEKKLRNQHLDLNIDYCYKEEEEDDERTLLDIACRSKGKCRFVRILTWYGANTNIINKKSGKTPIYEAIVRNDIETVEALLEIDWEEEHPTDVCRRASDINMHDMDSQTPAMAAAYLGRKDILSVLLKKDDISLRPIAGGIHPKRTLNEKKHISSANRFVHH